MEVEKCVKEGVLKQTFFELCECPFASVIFSLLSHFSFELRNLSTWLTWLKSLDQKTNKQTTCLDPASTGTFTRMLKNQKPAIGDSSQLQKLRRILHGFNTVPKRPSSS